MDEDDGFGYEGRTFQFVCHKKGDLSLEADEKVGSFTLPDVGESASDDALAYLEEAVREVYGKELEQEGLVLRGADGTVLCTAEDLREYVRKVMAQNATRGPIIFFREATAGPKKWQVPLRVRCADADGPVSAAAWDAAHAEVAFGFSLPWRTRPISHLSLEEEDDASSSALSDDGPLSALRKLCVATLGLDDAPTKRFAAVVSHSPVESMVSIATDKQVEEYFAQWVLRLHEARQERRQTQRRAAAQESGDGDDADKADADADAAAAAAAAEPNPEEEAELIRALVVDVAVMLEERNTLHRVHMEFLSTAHDAKTVQLLAPGTPPSEANSLPTAGASAAAAFEYNPSDMYGVLNKLKGTAMAALRAAGLVPPLEEHPIAEENPDDHDADWGAVHSCGSQDGPAALRNLLLIAEMPMCGDIALTNDRAVENMLIQLRVPGSPAAASSDATALRIRVDLGGETERPTVVGVHCSMREGAEIACEVQKFKYRLGRDDANIVSMLRSACAAAMGGAPLTANDQMLCTLEDGQEVAIGSDGMLREVLHAHAENEQPLRITVQRKRKAVVMERMISCQLHDDHAQFAFRFVVDDNNLLAAFREECKAELDLLPSDFVTLFVQVGPVPLGKDSVLREALLDNRDQPLVVMLARKPPSGRRGSRDIAVPASFSASASGSYGGSLKQTQRSVECTVGRKKVAFSFAFRLDEEGLLDHLHTCCKQAHAIGIDSRVKLTLNHYDADVLCSRDVSTDGQLRDVLADEKEFPVLHLTALVFASRRASQQTLKSNVSPGDSSRGNSASRDITESAGSMDGASMDCGSRNSARKHDRGDCFDDGSSVDSSNAPTPLSNRRQSWNAVAKDGDDPSHAKLPKPQPYDITSGGGKKPSLYDCFADDPNDDSVMHSDAGGYSGPSSRDNQQLPHRAVSSNISDAFRDDSGGEGGNRNFTAPTQTDSASTPRRTSDMGGGGGSVGKVGIVTAFEASPGEQPHLSPSPPPQDKKPHTGREYIRSLGLPSALLNGDKKKFRVVGDPVVDLIERRLRERKAAERARIEKQRKQMDELRSEIDARRQKHAESAKEHQLLEQRRKQEEAERRAEDVRKREEERIRRISNLKVDPNIILGKRSVLDAIEEKRKKAAQEDEERLTKFRTEARERFSWNHQFHSQLDQHQHLVMERAKKREEEKKTHVPLLDQPILPPEVPADIIKTNAYMRIVSELKQPLRTESSKKEELRKQREVRLAYYDQHLEIVGDGGESGGGGGGGGSGANPTFEPRPVEYPSRIRGEEARKEELRKLRDARMKYYESHPHVAVGGPTSTELQHHRGSEDATPRGAKGLAGADGSSPLAAVTPPPPQPPADGKELKKQFRQEATQAQPSAPAASEGPSSVTPTKRNQRDAVSPDAAAPSSTEGNAAAEAMATIPPKQIKSKQRGTSTDHPTAPNDAPAGVPDAKNAEEEPATQTTAGKTKEPKVRKRNTAQQPAVEPTEEPTVRQQQASSEGPSSAAVAHSTTDDTETMATIPQQKAKSKKHGKSVDQPPASNDAPAALPVATQTVEEAIGQPASTAATKTKEPKIRKRNTAQQPAVEPTEGPSAGQQAQETDAPGPSSSGAVPSTDKDPHKRRDKHKDGKGSSSIQPGATESDGAPDSSASPNPTRAPPPPPLTASLSDTADALQPQTSGVSPRRRSVRKGPSASPQNSLSAVLLPDEEIPSVRSGRDGDEGSLSLTYSTSDALDDGSAARARARRRSQQREEPEVIPSLTDDEGDLLPESPV